MGNVWTEQAKLFPGVVSLDDDTAVTGQAGSNTALVFRLLLAATERRPGCDGDTTVDRCRLG